MQFFGQPGFSCLTNKIRSSAESLIRCIFAHLHSILLQANSFTSLKFLYPISLPMVNILIKILFLSLLSRAPEYLSATVGALMFFYLTSSSFSLSFFFSILSRTSSLLILLVYLLFISFTSLTL